MTTEPAPTFIDTHAHLDDHQFERDVDRVLDDAAALGVRRVVNIGYRPQRWRTTVALGARRPEISFTLGLHPHHADEWSPALLADLTAMLNGEPAVAVGEIGLDFYRNLAPAPAQRAAFLAQLDLALARNLPVVIHQRSAEDEVLAILRDAPPPLVCILHSFDGGPELAALAVERGWYLGVGGLMTRSAAQPVRDLLRTIPRERLLLETDSPYLTPAGVKERRNTPATIPLVAARLAALLGVTVAEIAAVTTANARSVFRLPESDPIG